MRIVSLNQDRGIHENAHKGAAVHLKAIRKSFADLDHDVLPLDCPGNAVQQSLLALHERQPIDLLYERYALGKAAGARFAASYNVRYVVEVNAPLAEEAARWRGHVETAASIADDQTVFSNARSVLAVSEDTARYSIGRGACAEKVFVCTNGVDESVFFPRDRGRCKENLGIDAKRLVVGFHGRLRPWHGFERLVLATVELIEEGVPVHLLVVGEGPYLPLLQANLAATDYTLLSWVPHDSLGKIVAAFDILPLMYDATEPCYFSPLKLYEGMACGAVPVVPDAGNLKQIVRHKKTGIVYGGNGFVATTKRLHHDAELLNHLSHAAAEEALDHTWRHVALRTLQAAGV